MAYGRIYIHHVLSLSFLIFISPSMLSSVSCIILRQHSVNRRDDTLILQPHHNPLHHTTHQHSPPPIFLSPTQPSNPQTPPPHLYHPHLILTPITKHHPNNHPIPSLTTPSDALSHHLQPPRHLRPPHLPLHPPHRHLMARLGYLRRPAPRKAAGRSRARGWCRKRVWSCGRGSKEVMGEVLI